MPNPPTKVRTNDTPKSKKSVQLQALSFQELWNAYPKKDPYDDPTGEYENQCAIRLSVTFHGIGSAMKSFSQNVLKPMPGKKTLGRLILGGKSTATRAYELAEWLKLRPFLGLGKPENITGPDWQDKVKNRTGIIYFFGYWRQDGDSADVLSGGHIDLWNKDTLTPSVVSFLRFRIGMSRFRNPLTNNNWFSDLANSKEILFWEVK
ncbi:type VI secretion system amidase effector protein Tae4 [Burkholderia pyrrocinia]|uniref:type VI secretion system amidase effector protein Tae4 n=1 Tax=Burkholderia pyrrocinia TaxID=60550 RepID=UPI001FB30D0B|nr:type VI secretion system amidase effector protein Tae4 [Burkholderia pyrrocinia]UOB56631.1 type VI secretion system amidase effector protein Tae4 [Burkholderia pyrrocinia]HKU28048.1 type VI secretion system amidase effector protein Tae4 [Candidatus Sulfotelmatobacter sp.]